MPPKRILAIKLRELGDTVLWTPTLRSLIAAYPQAALDLLVLQPAVPLLKEHPGIRHIHSISGRGTLSLAKRLVSLRREHYDLVLGFHATTSLCRFVGLLGAKKQVVHHYSWEKTPRSSHEPIQEPAELTDAISRDAKVLATLGISVIKRDTRLFLTEEEGAWAKRQLASLPRPRVLFLPGSRLASHRYPKELWEKVVKKVKKAAFSPFVISDRSLSEQWQLSQFANAEKIPLFDTLTLRELMALAAEVEIAVGNDSGPIHIAAAMGTKTVSLFGPGCAGDYHPYPLSTHRLLREIVDCRLEGPADPSLFRYCSLEQCSHLTCLRSLKPETIHKEVMSLHSESNRV